MDLNSRSSRQTVERIHPGTSGFLFLVDRTVYFMTHPNVVISREVPVPRWPLSELGRARMHFANPGRSVRGWERAVDAQARIVGAVERLVAADRAAGDIAIVSHGAVGALLYCKLSDNTIDRRFDQPGKGGGNFFSFSLTPPVVYSSWMAID